MALIFCPECKNRISEYAQSCPYCGCPKDVIDRLLNEEFERKEQERRDREYQELLDEIDRIEEEKEVQRKESERIERQRKAHEELLKRERETAERKKKEKEELERKQREEAILDKQRSETLQHISWDTLFNKRSSYLSERLSLYEVIRTKKEQEIKAYMKQFYVEPDIRDYLSNHNNEFPDRPKLLMFLIYNKKIKLSYELIIEIFESTRLSFETEKKREATVWGYPIAVSAKRGNVSIDFGDDQRYVLNDEKDWKLLDYFSQKVAEECKAYYKRVNDSISSDYNPNKSSNGNIVRGNRCIYCNGSSTNGNVCDNCRIIYAKKRR